MREVAHRQPPPEHRSENQVENGADKSIAISQAASSAYGPKVRPEPAKISDSARIALPSATADPSGITFAAEHTLDNSVDAQIRRENRACFYQVDNKRDPSVPWSPACDNYTTPMPSDEPPAGQRSTW